MGAFDTVTIEVSLWAPAWATTVYVLPDSDGGWYWPSVEITPPLGARKVIPSVVAWPFARKAAARNRIPSPGRSETCFGTMTTAATVSRSDTTTMVESASDGLSR